MNETQVKTIIQQQLPHLLAQDPELRVFILRTVSEYYAGKQETESRFDRILDELRSDREEQARKWDEQTRKWDEQDQKWDAQVRKWDEQDQKWKENTEMLRKMQVQTDENIAEIKKANRRYDSAIGSIGSRWGLYSEASFRNGLKAILEESFGIEVLNLNEYDHDGDVFGRPDQVEIDVVIKNGVVILCEIKSSMSKGDMYVFDRKASFYEKQHHRPVTRKIVMCPMVDSRALPVAENLGIEIYSYSDQIESI